MKPKKSLGQNFLQSEEALDKIIGAGELENSDTVLEIGPGQGVLTEKLLEKAGKVIAVEKDDRLIPILQKKFAKEISEGKLKLIHADVLDIDSKNLQLKANSYKLIANIPYYITGEILRQFLEIQHQPSKIVLLLQKEVAERIVAKDLKESILSLSVKMYGMPALVAHVPKEAFSPMPKVDSAILSISNISKENFRDISEEQFFKIVKTGFSQKRKVLINNLSALFPREKIVEAFILYGIEEKARAENVSLPKWLQLSKKLTQN